MTTATDIQQIQTTANALTTAVSQSQMLLSEKIGALKAFDFTKKLLTVSTIKMLAEIKQSKEYNGLQIINQEGKLLTVSTWEQFCQGIGKSRQHIDEEIRNLSAFGEDFLETSQRMGVGYRDLRKLRKLDDEQREIIINGEAIKAEDKDSLIDLIEEMSAKNAHDKAELKQQISELTAKTNAQEKMIDNKDKKINQLDTKLNLRKDPSKAHLHAQALEQHITDEMQQAFSAVTTAIANFNTQVATLKQQASEEVPHLIEKLDNDISYTYNRIAELATADGIDINLAELVTPSWMADFNPPPAKGELEGVNDFELVGQTPEEIEAMNE